MQEKNTTETFQTMDDFKDQLDASFKRVKEGDLLTGTVLSITDTEVYVDLNSYTEGIIPLDELSNDPSFSIHSDIQVGDTITGSVLREEDASGNIILSLKEAVNTTAWDQLKVAKEEKRVYCVKISSVVNGGVITYVEGLRAFIPASQLSINYVDNLSEYVGKTVSAVIITVDKSSNKLVLSAKEVEQQQHEVETSNKVAHLQIGAITTGIIDKITPYGAFVHFGDGLSGLIHISQMCAKRIKSPHEVVKEGQEVTFKIIAIKDGKVSLSMKEVEDNSEVSTDFDDIDTEYSSGEEANTTLGDLLSKLNL